MLLLPPMAARLAAINSRYRLPVKVNLCQLASYSQWVQGQEHQVNLLEDIRNVGIIAHVDAGKTTTTERMLFNSGITTRVGNVDSGNTVTDFLELERQRGITIQSAAITFPWPRKEHCPPGTHPKTVNLIDTPGHQDFCFEVDRCLPILDGAVCIIDSVKGVEAHTERVWGSAQNFGIPRIIYCNKLDRDGASFRKSVLEIGSRLKGWPLVCQIPWWEEDKFVGVIDIIDSVGYRCTDRKTIRYDKDELVKQLASSNAHLVQEMAKARERLIETLVEVGQVALEDFIEKDGHFSSSDIKEAIRRSVRESNGFVIPVFAGSSLCHIGVEPLMDAMINYLPSPADRKDAKIAYIGSDRYALEEALQERVKKAETKNIASISSVFKVFEHPKEGVICFVRVYQGTLRRNAPLFNTNLAVTESPMGILQISADKTNDVLELSVGQIGALRGLKKSRTGDTLITTTNHKSPGPALRSLQILSTDIPPSVAFLQAEPYGKMASKQLEEALGNASRQDPSLQWHCNDQTDQFTVQGMGKLHLDVSLHAMRQKHKIDAQFSSIEVDYKECILTSSDPETVVLDRPVAGKPGKVTCQVEMKPLETEKIKAEMRTRATERDGNLYSIQTKNCDTDGRPSDEIGTDMVLDFDLDDAHQHLMNGAIAGMARGPQRAAPLYGCHVTITLSVGYGAYKTPTGGHFSEAARLGVQRTLANLGRSKSLGLVEPVMLVKITCPTQAASQVQHDISSRAGGQVLEVNDRSAEASQNDVGADGGKDEAKSKGRGKGVDANVDEDGDDSLSSRKRVWMDQIYTPPDPYDSVTSLRSKPSTERMVEIVAKVPYKEVLDYDDRLRSKTSGRHSMTMTFDSWLRVTGHREADLLSAGLADFLKR